MESVNVRKMTFADYSTFAKFYTDLHGIHHEALPEIFKKEVSLPPPDVFNKDLNDPKHVLLLAEYKNEPAGFCIMVLKEIPPDSEYPLVPHIIVHIDDIYIAPKFRRNGIATLLYRTAERYGKKLGADKMQLQVWSFNDAATALYRKLGMQPLFCKMEQKL